MTSAPVDPSPAVPQLVPELGVTDLGESLAFWVTLCGFEVLYDRPEEGFAYIHVGSAHLMLDQMGVGRDWTTGRLERPLGRGVNFEIAVPDIAPIVDRLAAAKWPLFMEPETKRYQTGETDVQVSQFLVQDPDGYLVRFSARVTAANN
ncbi:bleomycin resistance protein [Leifsonia sp. A12D58]|uniref:bleomycin resistance protein n=1 Tax=Leifsonia sp. A12D58 TaxID=3397674 RepID=UPI0039E07CCB